MDRSTRSPFELQITAAKGLSSALVGLPPYIARVPGEKQAATASDRTTTRKTFIALFFVPISTSVEVVVEVVVVQGEEFTL
jgi:hypothetical protein